MIRKGTCDDRARVCNETIVCSIDSYGKLLDDIRIAMMAAFYVGFNASNQFIKQSLMWLDVPANKQEQ